VAKDRFRSQNSSQPELPPPPPRPPFSDPPKFPSTNVVFSFQWTFFCRIAPTATFYCPSKTIPPAHAIYFASPLFFQVMKYLPPALIDLSFLRRIAFPPPLPLFFVTFAFQRRSPTLPRPPSLPVRGPLLPRPPRATLFRKSPTMLSPPWSLPYALFNFPLNFLPTPTAHQRRLPSTRLSAAASLS